MNRIFFVLVLLISLFLIDPKMAEAKSGCCSSHGGVCCGCGAQANGKVICNDGNRNSSCYYSEMVMCGGSSGATNTNPTITAPAPSPVVVKPTPKPSPKPSPVIKVIPTPQPTPSPSPSPELSPTPTPSPSPSPELSPTPEPVITPEPASSQPEVEEVVEETTEAQEPTKLGPGGNAFLSTLFKSIFRAMPGMGFLGLL